MPTSILRTEQPLTPLEAHFRRLADNDRAVRALTPNHGLRPKRRPAVRYHITRTGGMRRTAPSMSQKKASLPTKARVARAEAEALMRGTNLAHTLDTSCNARLRPAYAPPSAEMRRTLHCLPPARPTSRQQMRKQPAAGGAPAPRWFGKTALKCAAMTLLIKLNFRL
ncbi:hypothetical protein B0H15DRAFT_38522 [Mycena belliarum]|uniref:Uncharacterized protein n=1 Tax=Mycena belliarum TaxID=1033014 RepID=A0AAD6XHE4_9AGAR|nr:hypothetical protein B0H15DRAFT_38522 [Mycena belliae]